MTAYRYWRVSNIVDRAYQDSQTFSTIALIKFISPSGALATPDENKVLSNIVSPAGSAYKASYAFNNDLYKVASNETSYGENRSEEWYLGYDFTEPVEVTRVGIQARPSYNASTLDEWQRVIIEGSTDGSTWVIQGQCVFNTPDGSTAYIEKPITPFDEQTETKRRYWRLSELITPESAPNVASSLELARVRFETVEKVGAFNPRNVSSAQTPSYFDFSGSNVNLFHGNSQYFENNSLNTQSGYVSVTSPDWYVIYDFIYPVTVTAISLQLRDQARITSKSVISMKIESSTDKVTWDEVGYFNTSKIAWLPYDTKAVSSVLHPTPNTTPLSEKKQVSTHHRSTEVLKSSYPQETKRVEAKVTQLAFDLFSPYKKLAEDYWSVAIGRGERGYIAGVVYERVGESSLKIPVARRVYLYHQQVGSLVASTWSKEDGTYLFKNLRPDSVYMLIAVDHTGKWGLEGVAYKKAQEVVVDGLSIQYPLTQ